MAMKWPRMLLAVIGAFFSAGVVGGLIAAHTGFWDIPAAGLCAAFAVVVTYLAVPHHKMGSALLALSMGAVVAWYLLEPSFYPEFPAQYHDVAYERTHLPLIATCLGGILGLAVAVAFWSRLESSKPTMTSRNAEFKRQFPPSHFHPALNIPPPTRKLK